MLSIIFEVLNAIFGILKVVYNFIAGLIKKFIDSPFIFRVTTILSIPSAIITILVFVKDPKSDNKQVSTDLNTDAIYTQPKDTTKSILPLPTTKEKKDSVLRSTRTDSLNDEARKDSLDNIDLTVSSVRFSPSTETVYTDNNNQAIQMSERKPQKGFGKIAVRSFCDYCSDLGQITITHRSDTDSTAYTDRFLTNYDPEEKHKTTFIKELLPGKYDIWLDFYNQGDIEFTATIRENEIAIYNAKKTNPYGTGNGQILFTTTNFNHKWKLTINNTFVGIIDLKKNRVQKVVWPAGYKWIQIERLQTNNNDLIENTMQKGVQIHVGAEVVQPIE